jgi:hypothetical protein
LVAIIKAIGGIDHQLGAHGFLRLRQRPLAEMRRFLRFAGRRGQGTILRLVKAK